MKVGSRRRQTTAVLFVLLTASFLAASETQGGEALPQPMIGEAAPGFSLETVSGDTLSLDTLKGQIVVIHFAASW